MKLSITDCCVGWLLSAAAIAACTSAAPAADVPRWQPHDLNFQAEEAVETVANPFMVAFSATVSGPDGATFTIPGFYDGRGIWKIRIAPNAPGKWRVVTQCDLPALNARSAELNCVANTNSNVHGLLRVDPDHPHHFIFEDGTRFFMQGYEYDWLWALDMDQPGVPTVEKTLDLLVEHGFNYVILNSYAYDTSWRKGKSSEDDFGPSLLHPWEGTAEQPLHQRMNLAYWQHYDQVIAALAERGMQAHMLIKVYNKSVKWPARGSAEESLFFRWLVARYAAYPNIIWDFSKEAHNEKDLEYKQAWLKWIREHDPYRHLTTVHDDDQANDSGAYDELTDFRADQAHQNFHATILRQRARRAWPVANVESDYEHGPGGPDDKTYGRTHTPQGLIRTAWEIQMAGGYNAYYYTYTAWDVIRPLDVPTGYALYKIFGDFWRSTRYWTLDPADELVSEGYCLARPGHEYVVYQNEPAAFTLQISGADAPLKAVWFNPFNGNRREAGPLNNGEVRLTPPSDWGSAPLVLYATDGP